MFQLEAEIQAQTEPLPAATFVPEALLPAQPPAGLLAETTAAPELLVAPVDAVLPPTEPLVLSPPPELLVAPAQPVITAPLPEGLIGLGLVIAGLIAAVLALILFRVRR